MHFFSQKSLVLNENYKIKELMQNRIAKVVHLIKNKKRSSFKEFLLLNFRFEAEGAEQKPVDVKIVNFVNATFAHAVTDVLILMQSATEAQVE